MNKKNIEQTMLRLEACATHLETAQSDWQKSNTEWLNKMQEWQLLMTAWQKEMIRYNANYFRNQKAEIAEKLRQEEKARAFRDGSNDASAAPPVAETKTPEPGNVGARKINPDRPCVTGPGGKLYSAEDLFKRAKDSVGGAYTNATPAEANTRLRVNLGRAVKGFAINHAITFSEAWHTVYDTLTMVLEYDPRLQSDHVRPIDVLDVRGHLDIAWSVARLLRDRMPASA